MSKTYKIKVDTDYKSGSERVDYSGFGVHGKIGKSKNRSDRRKNRQECRKLRGFSYVAS